MAMPLLLYTFAVDKKIVIYNDVLNLTTFILIFIYKITFNSLELQSVQFVYFSGKRTTFTVERRALASYTS